MPLLRTTSNLVRRRKRPRRPPQRPPSVNSTAISTTISWLSFVLATTSISSISHLRLLVLPPVFSPLQHYLLPTTVHGFVVHYHPHHHQQTKRLFGGFSTTLPVRMPRGVKKEHLPSKVCVICNRPFTWRKKWERCWDEVTTCSKSCNNQRRLQNKNNNMKQHQNDQDHRYPQQRRSMTTESTPRSETTPTAATTSKMSVSETAYPQDIDTWSQNNDEQEFAELLSTIHLDDGTGENENDAICDSDSDGSASSRGQTIDSTSEIGGSFVVGQYNDGTSTSQQQQQDDDDHNKEELDLDPDQDLDLDLDPIQQKKAERKAAKKRKKAERRAQREGRGDPSAGQKQCDMCGKSVNLLVRCMYEEGQTDWKMVCGSCWNVCSGGVVDGDKDHPHYRYGGLWKNRRRQ